MIAPNPGALKRCLGFYQFEEGDIPLTHIEGRPAGLCSDGGAPQWVGKMDKHGLIRVDCVNYPAAWMQIRLPQEVVDAMHSDVEITDSEEES